MDRRENVRILVVGPLDPDAFADNVVDTCRRMGHDVRAVGAAREVPRGRRLQNATHVLADQVKRLDLVSQQHLVRAAREFQPDLVLTIDRRIRPEIAEAMRQNSGAIALWFPDHVANMGKHDMFLAPYDRIYLKSQPVVNQLAGLQGLPVAYLPEASNSRWHNPIGHYGTEPVIVLAGNIHPTRAALLDRLIVAQIPLAIYGAPMSTWVGYPRVRQAHRGRPVFREEKARVFRNARGVLNNLHPAEFAGSNCRLFEATACGAAVLTEWRAGMSDLFDHDREVLAFSTFDELVDRCRWLLQDPANGTPIADAAAIRSGRDHRYEARLATIFDDLGLTSDPPTT